MRAPVIATLLALLGGLFLLRVVPAMNLFVDDVRGYLAAQLVRLGNKRLKIGNINAEGALSLFGVYLSDKCCSDCCWRVFASLGHPTEQQLFL